ncbi:hypothetical protein OXYTRIMIC_010 [Oxytricha trifallax]|uniref:Uncharacterized protein n=1 Tax=Oxytricha trifallax TaxID=1172189 RepID=A0A073HZN0_9SPIT|nr:hypothetical protein OXYTRIMIC_010 [Oxytricha trifallax]
MLFVIHLDIEYRGLLRRILHSKISFFLIIIIGVQAESVQSMERRRFRNFQYKNSKIKMRASRVISRRTIYQAKFLYTLSDQGIGIRDCRAQQQLLFYFFISC